MFRFSGGGSEASGPPQTFLRFRFHVCVCKARCVFLYHDLALTPFGRTRVSRLGGPRNCRQGLGVSRGGPRPRFGAFGRVVLFLRRWATRAFLPHQGENISAITTIEQASIRRLLVRSSLSCCRLMLEARLAMPRLLDNRRNLAPNPVGCGSSSSPSLPQPWPSNRADPVTGRNFLPCSKGFFSN